MNDHNIELEKLYNDVEQFIESSIETQENTSLILEGIESIYEEETRKNPIPINSEKKRVIVDSREEYYPFLLAVYLLINKVNILHEILDFNRANFKSNRLIEDAGFDVFLKTYVWESIKTYRGNLNISDVDFDSFIFSWEEYFRKSGADDSWKIHFIFDEEFKKALLDGVSNFVVKDDHCLLPDFFSKRDIKSCVRFDVPASSVADLFLRLHNHNKIGHWCSRSNTANWLAGRIMTKGARQKLYINPKSEPLKNILLGKKLSARKLLPNILP
jgi:hypothetical protein